MRSAILSILALVTTLQTTQDLYIDWGKLSNVTRWVEKMKNSVPSYAKADGDGAKVFEAFFKKVTGMLE